MKILVTGANGQLGRNIGKVFTQANINDVTYTDFDTLDITSSVDVERVLTETHYDILINCAAYTAVDRAESEALLAAKINTEAVGNLASAARKTGTKVIHISTDYVFPGDSCRPYNEHDEPNPRSIYGRTKFEGEAVLKSFCPDCIIIRTAWLYSEEGNNFVKTMLAKGSRGESLRVVSDQIGTPTYAKDLAEAILAIVKAEQWYPGIYHFTDEGVASWYDFAKSIFRIARLNVDVTPCASSEYKTPACRPLFSVLNKSKIKKTYSLKIPYWEDSLNECIKNICNDL
ncbi:MAG: dTDP-4-dehydrorhamnose reductase [Prevotella sp.]|nr:dTDP-4-dehydrorhamnose reductase [Bacteroides sp.]MCM1366120.1 dTDP-4-dehydrorhamnose reductase [Prevotella sp.]MCM1437529.1 dTDP-4-dehydrorhamnose reductase [Prevotella sp.]